MSNVVFRVFINNEVYKEFNGKEIRDYLIDWNGDFQNGILLNTNDGQVKVLEFSLLNPKKNDGIQVTGIFLEKV